MKKWAALLLGMGSLAAPPALAETRSFSVDEGTNFAAALSPNGKSIVIDLQGELRILPAKGGAASYLVELPDEARLPAWSPDGQWIAFQHFSAGHWRIFIIARDGTGLRQLTQGMSDDREPVWSADGKAIFFSSDRAGNFDIWKVGLDSGAPEQLTKSQAEEYFPAVASDGRLAFVSASQDDQTLMLREDGKDRALLSSKNDLVGPVWNPDGSRLAYVEYRQNNEGRDAGMSALNMVDPATGAITRQTGEREDVFTGRPQWRADGGLLYAADGKIRTRRGAAAKDILFTARFAVERPEPYRFKRQEFLSAAPQAAKGIMSPVVSPDGREIAFVALGDIWLLTIGKAQPERLTDDPWVDIDPTWSPDGSKLAFASDRRGNGIMDIYVRDIKTGREERVTETEESLTAPVFSPDGKSLAVSMLDHGDWHANTLHVLDLGTRQLRKLDEAQFKPSPPRWLPDGSAIASVALDYISKRYRKGLNEVRLVPLDGSPPHFVSPTPGVALGIRSANGISWSPDGSQAAFVEDGVLWSAATTPDGNFNGTPRRLTSDIADYPSWTADSKAIVFASVDKLKRFNIDDGSVDDIPLALDWTPHRSKGRKVIRAGRLFDARSLDYRTNVDILVENNVIKEIAPRRADWSDVEIVDASDKTVIPGLFENHIHNFIINGEITGRVALSYGVTSIREPGTDPSEGRESKEAWASGRRIGPRLFTTGLIEGGRVYYPMSFPVRSPAALELELDRAARYDVDFIKTYEQLDAPFLKRTIEFAHKLGIPVTSHDAYPAARFGADAVEHLTARDRASIGDRQSALGNIYQDVAQIYAQSGMAVVPTAIGGSMRTGGYYLQQAGRSMIDLPQMKLLPERFRNSRQIAGAVVPGKSAFDARLLAESTAPLRTLIAAGVSIPTGTDTAFYNIGFGIFGEMCYYVEAGMTPAQAIQQATIESARLNHVDDLLGTIEPGKLADMVIVAGDPLARITDLVNISAVVKDGEVYTLDRLLAGPR
jgi:Tol biopolymer transport system component/imidazolonepropionase-like amidohydrolase